MTGKVFGMLTVVRTVQDLRPGQHWLCSCECLSEHIVSGSNLRTGQVKSCGCLTRQPSEDLTGRVFGRLTVERLNADGGGWLCACSCGGSATPTRYALISGNSQSCGCKRRESLRKVAIARLAPMHRESYFDRLMHEDEYEGPDLSEFGL